jgi:hypothetical protein
MKSFKVKFSNRIEYHNEKGLLHRLDRPARIWTRGENKGDLAWFINGLRHREDGPAIEYQDGTKAWFINDKRHREDGPAIVYYNNAKSWYLNGIEYSEREYYQEITNIKLKRILNL